MKTLQSFAVLLTLTLSQTVAAMKQEGAPPTANVNVVNTPTVVVTNGNNGPVPVELSTDSASLVSSGYQVFLDVFCASNQALYTVPDGYLLIIEDASGSAVRSSSPDTIVDDPNVQLSLRTVNNGTFALTQFAWSNQLPMSGGRQVTAYAEPNSEVSLSVAGCSQPVSVSASFSGRLIPVNSQ